MTINIVSLSAFIMVLGIVVDDAIVIGERVYTEIESHGGGTETVIRLNGSPPRRPLGC